MATHSFGRTLDELRDKPLEELEAVDVKDEDLEPIAFDDFSEPDTNEKAF